MDNVRFHKLGWIVAAGLAGIILGGGFRQGGDAKMAVVDLAKVVETSNFGQDNQKTFNKMKDDREGILEFIDTYRVLTVEQASKLRELSLKPNITPAEKAELDRIKADVIAADKRNKEIIQKTNLTPEERTLMEENARRSQTMEITAQRWLREFTSDMQGWADKQKMASIERARQAIQEVGRTGGYSIIFEIGVAPYGANDVSDAALKAMNARK
ncbi:MAG TPA: OmpH family outer membrane protein [Fimbriimonadaceae bacterium]|nr:OmpH family outer membrane protein [Fimbriimonadaceae bacterium]